MKNTFNISFFIRKNRGSASERSVFVRINLNSSRADFSSQLKIPEKSWDSNKAFPQKNTLSLKRTCAQLEEIRMKLISIYQEEKLINPHLRANQIKEVFFGIKPEIDNNLSDLVKYHKEKTKTILAPGTLKNYNATEKYLSRFLKKQFHQEDIKLKDITSKFIFEFEYFLRTYEPVDHHKALSNNGVMKHMERFKKLINLALKIDWLEKDPFRKFTPKFDKVERDFLTPAELEKIKNKKFVGTRLSQVRDIFIFSCYTGLSYIDVVHLSEENIIIGIDGGRWISTHRQKTFSKVFLPLLPQAESILKKYANNTRAQYKGVLLPAASNQKTNEYLKEIAEICGIKKNLTFHIARHTFATTVTLTNGVPIETVSKMLGHSKLSTTQIYAKVVENKIGEDMAILKAKLNPETKRRKSK